MRCFRVEELYIVPEKGKPGAAVETVRVNAGGGLDGDRHCQNGAKALCISTEGIGRWMQEELKGVCFGRFKANILLSGTADCKLETGTRLEGGQAAIVITGGKGACYEDCVRYKAGLPCRLRSECWFAVGARDGGLCRGEHLRAYSISDVTNVSKK